MLAAALFSSTSADWVIAVLSVFSVLLIPTLIFIVRGAIKWTRVEDRLGTLVEQVQHLISDQDQVHAQLLEQMRVDRENADRRLRFVEEYWMLRGRDSA